MAQVQVDMREVERLVEEGEPLEMDLQLPSPEIEPEDTFVLAPVPKDKLLVLYNPDAENGSEIIYDGRD